MELPPFSPEFLDLSDEQLGLRVWAWWIGAEATWAQIPPGAVLPLDEHFVEMVRHKVLAADTDSAEHAALEKALKRLAANDLTGGGRLFRDWFHRDQVIFAAALDEARTGRRKQRHIAKRSRLDPLQGIILEILKRRPTTNEAELLEALREYEKGDVIAEITDSEIAFNTKAGRLAEAPITGLKHRLSRARKRLGISPTG
jgi:hypothetical protein